MPITEILWKWNMKLLFYNSDERPNLFENRPLMLTFIREQAKIEKET